MRFLLLFFISFSAFSFSNNEIRTEKVGVPAAFKPEELKNVGISEHLGAQIDLSLKFNNENGESVSLSRYVDGKRPLLLSLVYYSCPNLCNFHLNGVTNTLKRLDLSVGNEFDMVVVSFDPKEKPELAAKKRQAYLKEYNRNSATDSWHFLTGNESEISALAKSVGFSYKWDEKSEQWIHSSGLVVLTPNGRISKYLHGIDFNEKVLKLSLVEASEGKIGTLVDKLALMCMSYTSTLGSKTKLVMNLVRVFSVMILVFIAVAIWRLMRKRGENG